MPEINITIPNASETVKGIVEEATQAQVTAGTDTGETGAQLFAAPSKIAAIYQKISTLFSSVMGLVLTGFAAGANSPVLGTDTLAQALAKFQGQINARPTTGGDTTYAFRANNLSDLASAATARTNLGAVGTSDTQTLTNKRLTPRVQTVASSATVTPSADSDDEVVITAQAAGLTLANPSGTPTQGQALIIRIKDNGTSRSISYGSEYRAIGVTLPTATTISKTVYLGLIYNSTDTKWDCIGVSQEA